MKRFTKRCLGVLLSGAVVLVGLQTADPRPAFGFQEAHQHRDDLRKEILEEVEKLIDKRMAELREEIGQMLGQSGGGRRATARDEKASRESLRRAARQKAAATKAEARAKAKARGAERRRRGSKKREGALERAESARDRLEALRRELGENPLSGGPTGSGQGFLGITMESDGGEGVRIDQVVPGSPAASAGLQADDRIVGINGRGIEGTSSLQEIVQNAGAGNQIEIEVLREGNSLNLGATLGTRGEGPLASSDLPEPGASSRGTTVAPSADTRPPEMPREYRESSDRPGFLGVNISDGDGGVAVTGLIDGHAAESVGIEAGDVIVGIDGRDVTSIADLQEIIGGAGAGTRIKVKVRRGFEEKVFALRLGPRPGSEAVEIHDLEMDDEEDAQPERKRRREERSDDAPNSSGGAWMGITIEPVDQVTREVLGLSASEGVMVDSVRDGSPAEAAGLQRADLILSFDGNSVGSGDELGNMVRSHSPGDKVVLGVLRKGDRIKVKIKLGSR